MNDDMQRLPGGISCADVSELAGLYVLDALETAEAERITAHLATCAEPHAEIAELGAVVPALAMSVDEVDAPADLKRRVLESYDRYAMAAAPVPVSQPRQRYRRARLHPSRRGRSRHPHALPRARLRTAAVARLGRGRSGGARPCRGRRLGARHPAARRFGDATCRDDGRGARSSGPTGTRASPCSQGTGPAAGVSGFVAFSPDGEGYMVMTDVPEAPAGMTYQAWYVVDGQPASAGTMSADADGFVIAEGLPPMAGTDLMAITLEPAGGSAEPTSDPIVVGEMVTRA